DVGTGSDAGADLQVRPRTCIETFLRPEPRVRAGLLLGRNRAATSCVDLSDGLADGVRQLATASGVGITLDGDAVPLSDETRRWHQERGADAIASALGGGEDYELLFTVRPTHRGRLRAVRQLLGDLPIIRIGVVTRARELLLGGKTGTTALPAGYEHFQRGG
ncbi:MAG: AIR synthase-related protein, partial [Vicinamibacterales bacterium]